MKHVVQASGGLSSAEAGVRVAAAHGVDDLTMLFCDTLVEDADLYRFLIESTAYITGVAVESVFDLSARATALPIVSEATMPARRELLASLRRDAVERLPKLVWLCEGRTPWEVIFDTRFLSHRADKCSEFLKRRQADAWREANCIRTQTLIYLGFGFNEQKRIERSRARFSEKGWTTEFPMDDAPLLVRVPLMQAWMDRGIQPPRLYFRGFPHNNCSGFCFKQGQAEKARLLNYDPCYYGFNERQEERFRDTIRAGTAMLLDRRNGGKRVISLKQFREGIQNGGLYDQNDRGSCSCFAEVEDEQET